MKPIEGHGKELELQLERAKTEAVSLAEAATQAGQALEALVEAEGAARARVGEALGARETARRAGRGRRATRHRFWHPRSRGSKRSSARARPQALGALGLWIMPSTWT